MTFVISIQLYSIQGNVTFRHDNNNTNNNKSIMEMTHCWSLIRSISSQQLWKQQTSFSSIRGDKPLMPSFSTEWFSFLILLQGTFNPLQMDPPIQFYSNIQCSPEAHQMAFIRITQVFAMPNASMIWFSSTSSTFLFSSNIQWKHIHFGIQAMVKLKYPQPPSWTPSTSRWPVCHSA